MQKKPLIVFSFLILAAVGVRAQEVCSARIVVTDTVLLRDSAGVIDSVRFLLRPEESADSLHWFPEALFADPSADSQWVTLGYQDTLMVRLEAYFDSTNLFRWKEPDYVRRHTEYNYVTTPDSSSLCRPGSITVDNNATSYCADMTYPVGSRSFIIRPDTTAYTGDMMSLVRGIPKDSTFRPFYIDTVYMYDPTRSRTFHLNMTYFSSTEVMDSTSSLPVILYTQHILDTAFFGIDSVAYIDTTFTGIIGYQNPGMRTIQSMTLNATYNFYHRPHGMAVYCFYEKPQTHSQTKHSLTISRLELVGSCMAEDSIELHGPVCRGVDTIVRFDTIAEGLLPWVVSGDTMTGAGDYAIPLPAEFPACDSLILLSLTVMENVWDTTYHYICPRELPYAIDSFIVYQDTSFSIVLKGRYGRDSTLTRFVFVGVDSDTTLYDTVVEDQLPRAFLDSLFYDEVENAPFVLFNEKGCDSTIYYNLFVFWNGDHCDSSLTFPTLVTPNGDGINDQFVIGGLLENDCFKFNDLYVYDRTGQLVYHGHNIASEADWWNPDSQRAPDATYFYIFKAHGVTIHTMRQGLVEVLR